MGHFSWQDCKIKIGRTLTFPGFYNSHNGILPDSRGSWKHGLMTKQTKLFTPLSRSPTHPHFFTFVQSLTSDIHTMDPWYDFAAAGKHSTLR